MIDRALLFLRDDWNAALLARLGGGAPGTEEAVAFVDGDKLDPLTLKVGAINLLLVNLEEERLMRPDDPFTRLLPAGPVAARPPVRLNLLILAVARHRAYEAGLAALAALLAHVQSRPVHEPRTSPALDPGIDRLIIELHTLALSEQNDLWGALRLAYHPSLLFRLRLLMIRDDSALPGPPIIEPQLELVHADPAAR